MIMLQNPTINEKKDNFQIVEIFHKSIFNCSQFIIIAELRISSVNLMKLILNSNKILSKFKILHLIV